MTDQLNRVLVAEDHLASRQLLERYLARWGYQVTVASDGSEVLRLMELPGAPCIALVDCLIPRVNGVEVCRRIRSQRERPYQYLMILTVNDRPDEIRGLEEVGADDCVVKPFVLDELRARVRLAQRVVALERKVAEMAVDSRS